ncbi:MAG: hypothetical protein L0387_40440 [Acidobacteria bacterium]|nr:hypothetical protein [Acidobacteriota bacterium]
MHPPANVTARVHRYGDVAAGATPWVQRTVGPPNKEVFFPPEVALV